MKKILLYLMLLFVIVLLVSCGQKNAKGDLGNLDEIEDNKQVNDIEDNVADDKEEVGDDEDITDDKEDIEEAESKAIDVEGLSQKDLDDLKEDFEDLSFEDINGLS